MKGDKISVTLTGIDHPISVIASKQGRRVERKTTTGRVKWVEVREVTRGGKPTGNGLSVRLDAVLSISETRVEP